MIQIFLEISDRFYVTLVSDRIVVDSVNFELKDCFNDTLHYLSGIEIDEAIIMAPLQYIKTPSENTCSPYNAVVGQSTYNCTLQKSDVIKLKALMELLKVKKVTGLDKFGFLNLLARKDGIYAENLGDVAFFYKRSGANRAFLYSKNVPSNVPLTNVKDLWHPRLLSEFANKDVLTYEDHACRKHLCMCGFYLSELGKSYTFDFSTLYSQCSAEEPLIEQEENQEPETKIAKFERRRVINREKHVHSKINKYNLITGSLNVAAIFIMTVLVAFSMFCKKDVTYLEAQTSHKETTIENEKARDEILNKVSINSITTSQIEKIEQIMSIKSKATLGEVKVSWEGELECIYYVDSLDYADALATKLSVVASIASSNYEGTVQLEDSVRYKIHYVFETTT